MVSRSKIDVIQEYLYSLKFHRNPYVGKFRMSIREKREPILSVTAKDCRWDYISGYAKGGQRANKKNVGVRCTHKASGAVGTGKETRSQSQNRRNAFIRMVESETFKTWARIQISRILHHLPKESIEEKVEKMMQEIKIETWENNIWKELEK